MRKSMMTMTLLAAGLMAGCSTSMVRPDDPPHVAASLRKVDYCRKNPDKFECEPYVRAAAKIAKWRAEDKADQRDRMTGNTPALNWEPILSVPGAKMLPTDGLRHICSPMVMPAAPIGC